MLVYFNMSPILTQYFLLSFLSLWLAVFFFLDIQRCIFPICLYIFLTDSRTYEYFSSVLHFLYFIAYRPMPPHLFMSTCPCLPCISSVHFFSVSTVIFFFSSPIFLDNLFLLSCLSSLLMHTHFPTPKLRIKSPCEDKSGSSCPSFASVNFCSSTL